MTNANIASSLPMTLKLEGEIGIYRALELKGELAAALEASRYLELDLSSITELDSAGVQLLLAAKRHADAHDRTLRLSGHSAAVCEVLTRLNLSMQLDDPSADRPLRSDAREAQP